MSQVSSKSLVEAAQQGDAGAFRELYEQNVEVVFAYVRRRTTYHEAEDISAEVFCTAWRKLPDFTDTGTPVRAWLLTIAKNQLASLGRRQSVLTIRPTSRETEVDGATPPADQEALRSITKDSIEAGLICLSVIHQNVLRLRFLEERSVRECADELALTESNVRVQTFRALKQLRSLVGEAAA